MRQDLVTILFSDVDKGYRSMDRRTVAWLAKMKTKFTIEVGGTTPER